MSEPIFGSTTRQEFSLCDKINLKNLSACNIDTNILNVNHIFIDDNDVTNNILQGCNVVDIDALTNDVFDSRIQTIDCNFQINAQDVLEATTSPPNIVNVGIIDGNQDRDVIIWNNTTGVWEINQGVAAQNGTKILLAPVLPPTVELGADPSLPQVEQAPLLHDTQVQMSGFRMEWNPGPSVTNYLNGFGIDTNSRVDNRFTVSVPPDILDFITSNVSSTIMTPSRLPIFNGSSYPFILGDYVYAISPVPPDGLNIRIYDMEHGTLVLKNTIPWVALFPPVQMSTGHGTEDMSVIFEGYGSTIVFAVGTFTATPIVPTVYILDVSDPCNPKAASYITLSSGIVTTFNNNLAAPGVETYSIGTAWVNIPGVNLVQRVRMSGNIMVFINQNSGGGPTTDVMCLIDISNPYRPLLRSVLDFSAQPGVGAGFNAQDPNIRGPWVLLGSRISNQRILLFNISDPSAPYLAANSGNLGAGIQWTAGTVDWVSETVFITTQILANRIQIWRLNPTLGTSVNPAQAVGTMTLLSTLALNSPYSVKVLRNIALIGAGGTTSPNICYAVDISNLLAPFVVDSFTVGNGEGVLLGSFNGRYLSVITGPGNNTLYILDLGGASFESMETGSLAARYINNKGLLHSHDVNVSNALNVGHRAQFDKQVGIGGQLRYHPIQSAVTGWLTTTQQTQSNMIMTSRNDFGDVVWQPAPIQIHSIASPASTFTYPLVIALPLAKITNSNSGGTIRTFPAQTWGGIWTLGGANRYSSAAAAVGDYIEWTGVVFPKFQSSTYSLQIYTGATLGSGTWSWRIDGVVLTSTSLAAVNVQFPGGVVLGGPHTVRLQVTTAGATFQSYDDTLYIVQLS